MYFSSKCGVKLCAILTEGKKSRCLIDLKLSIGNSLKKGTCRIRLKVDLISEIPEWRERGVRCHYELSLLGVSQGQL